MEQMNKKMAMVAVGALAGGAGGVIAGSMVDKTDYATKDPNSAYNAKLGAAGLAAVAGVAALMTKHPVIGVVLLTVGGGMGYEAYSSHSAYQAATAPPTATLNPGGAGGSPVTITAQPGGVPTITGGVPVIMGGPTGITTGISPTPLSLPQAAGSMRFRQQSGAAVRLGMGQSGAAVRLGMGQSGAAVRLGMQR